MTRGRKLRARGRSVAPGRMLFEQWINSSCGLDISISRFVVEATAIVKQAIEAMSTLRTLHCTRLVRLPSFVMRSQGQRGSAAGFAIVASLDPRQSTRVHIRNGVSVAQLSASSGNAGVGDFRYRAL